MLQTYNILIISLRTICNFVKHSYEIFESSGEGERCVARPHNDSPYSYDQLCACLVPLL